MAAETATVAPNASQRPPPPANRFLLMNSTLTPDQELCGNFVQLLSELFDQ
jgi:hypothetical protein